MWRYDAGMPRGDMVIVTWCSASGSSVQKSQLLLAERRLVRGSRFTAWFRSGNFSGSRRKNTGGVVAHEIPVARVGVELHGETPDVALGIGCAALAGDGRETHEAFGLLADPGEDRRTRVFGDVLRHRKGAECARAFGMHTPFGDYFAVEMREFLEEPRVLQRHGAADACGLDVLVVGDRPAVLSGKLFLFVHGVFLLCGLDFL